MDKDLKNKTVAELEEIATAYEQKKFIAKNIYWLELKFPGHDASADSEEVVDSTIVRYEKGNTAYDYHFLVGFQLTKAQLEYNTKMGPYEP